MKKFSSPRDATEELIKKIGKKLIVATPLGAGKPNHLLNELYLSAKNDPELELTILTALTLQKPKGKSFLEKRFLGPFVERVFGKYPDPLFEIDRVANVLPPNVKVIEFYLKAGEYKNHSHEQRYYLSSNYTHAVRDIFERGANVICQHVSKSEVGGGEAFSLSCNSDTTRDLVDLLKANNRNFVTVAQVNQDLPFMYGEAVVSPNFFDIVVDNRELDFPIFAPPKMSVSDADYMIGFHSSSLIKDDGEIQIGIGSLGDALVYALCLRQNENEKYRQILNKLRIDVSSFPILEKFGEFKTFSKGLFAATEMLVDSFANLYKQKILKKKVFDSVVIQRLLNQEKIKEEFDTEIFSLLYEEKVIRSYLSQDDVNFLKEFGIIRSPVKWENDFLVLENGERISTNIFDTDLKKIIGNRLRNGAVAHAGFFLGPRAFYNFLKELPISERKLFRMKRISQINQLYGHEEIDRLQRLNGRFINTCMKVSLNGAACSDALEDGNQISGVGGQYNFVAMAHELPGARSVLQLRSTRVGKKGRLESNIVFSYGNCTIPRHLRDVVVTEYGIADLRGKTDEEVAVELIQIADSRFQDELIAQAKKAFKLPQDFQLLDRFGENLPSAYQSRLRDFKREGFFPAFPLGTDFTEEEIQLGRALKKLKKMMNRKASFVKFIFLCLLPSRKNKTFDSALKRMKLNQPAGFKERFFKKIVLRALTES